MGTPTVAGDTVAQFIKDLGYTIAGDNITSIVIEPNTVTVNKSDIIPIDWTGRADD